MKRQTVPNWKKPLSVSRVRGNNTARTVEAPPEKHGWLEGLRRTLGNESYFSLAKFMGIPEGDCRKLAKLQRSKVGEIDQNAGWSALAEGVDDLIARLMSVRMELQRKLTEDRRRRAARRNRIENQ